MFRFSSAARHIALTLIALGSMVAIPQSATNLYTVEIVVFRNDGQIGALTGSTSAQAEAEDGVEATLVPTRKLSNAAAKLRSNGIRVLAHTAWTQSPTGCAGSACRTAVRGVSATQLGLARAGISGKVGLQRGQYLFLGVDLTIDDGGRQYHILESRQFKVDQPQYFDHPAVGVLAVVTAAAK
ncbi:MAG: CsiV family protein [Pseudomonadota bacterium]